MFPIAALSIGSIPFFATRIFGSIFWVALISRLQSEGLLTFLNNLGPLAVDLHLVCPKWLNGDIGLVVLGLLALIESAADKDPDIAELFSTFDSEIKAIGNFAFTRLITASVAVGVTTDAVLRAGFGTETLLAAVSAFLVWLVAKLRDDVMRMLRLMDDGDAVGVRRLISWAEDIGVGAGLFFLVIMPALTLIAAGIAIGALFGLDLYLKKVEKNRKRPCPHCGHLNHLSAPSCGNCRQILPEPKTLGFLGQPLTQIVTDHPFHVHELLARRRCRSCGHLLEKRSLAQTCPVCQTPAFSHPEEAQAYLKHIRARLPQTLIVCGILGLLPIIGLIPGIIYYRIRLIVSLRGWISPARGCLTRGFIRLAIILLLAFQWVPFFGALSLPLMAYINYFMYETAFKQSLKKLNSEASSDE